MATKVFLFQIHLVMTPWYDVMNPEVQTFDKNELMGAAAGEFAKFLETIPNDEAMTPIISHKELDDGEISELRQN